METTIVQNSPLSIQNASPSALAVLPTELAKRTGCSRELVAIVAKSVSDGDTIRVLLASDLSRATLALTAELEACAKQYTGCPNTDEMTFDECVFFVTTQFGYLNIGEIRHAFRLAAAGELDGVKLEAYFGTFTVGMLGKLLVGYKVYRDRVSAEILKAEKEAGLQKAEVLKSTNWDSVAWAERRLAALLANENLEYRHCTAHDYDWFTGTGQMQVTEDQKQEAWKDAFGLEWSEMSAQADRGSYSAREVLRRVGSGLFDEGFKSGRMVIAKQLLVLRWIQSQKSE